MAEVLVHLNEGVGELVLNRPKQRNSLTGPLVSELDRGLNELLEDSNCKAVVVRGAEGYFCAGLDLKAFSATPAPEWRSDFQSLWAKYHETVYHADVPIIGALEGFAIAGGSSLALSCDFLVAGETAFMHVSEVERNMLAPLNVFWLTQRYGYQVALRLGLLGERWSARDLLAAGIVERCVENDQVVSTALEMAERFASFDGDNVRALKRSIKVGIEREGTTFVGLLDHIKSAASAER
jgi:enoyl-CoA hydratase